MGAKSKESHRLLDYQLTDFLEVKLGDRAKVDKAKEKILKSSSFKGPHLHQFPAIGTQETCVILAKGFSKKLKKMCVVNSDGLVREVSLKDKLI